MKLFLSFAYFMLTVICYDFICPETSENCDCLVNSKKETINFKCVGSDKNSRLQIILHQGWELLFRCIEGVENNSLSLVPTLSENLFSENVTLIINYCVLPDHISSITNKLPAARIKELVFSIHNEKKISGNFFDVVLSIKEIRLEEFKLKSLNESFFVNLPQIEAINLDHNLFSTLPVNLFYTNKNLKHLSICYNETPKSHPEFILPKDMFINCWKLQTVSLSFNGKMVIPENFFPNTSNLENLNLRGNNLTNFDG